MFANEITGLTLASEVADVMFPNIAGDSYRADVSFVATMRALLSSRVPDGESVYLHWHNMQQVIGETMAGDNFRSKLGDEFMAEEKLPDSGVLCIYAIGGRDDAENASCFKILDEEADKCFLKDYKPLRDLETWVERSTNIQARFYINAEKRNTVIYIGTMNYGRWHLLESLMPRYFPWYFKDAPLTQEELELVKTLTKRVASSYREAIEAFARKFDFRVASIRMKLAGFETKFDRIKLDSVRKQISTLNEELARLESQFSTFYQQLGDFRIQEAGLAEKINQGGGEESNEMLEYFLSNEALNLVSVGDGDIEFFVTTCMSNFDPDAAENAIANKNSYMYVTSDGIRVRSYFSGEMTEERAERLLRAIFLDEIFKVRLCAAYRLDFSTGRYGGISGYTFPISIRNDYIPNPHIQGYSCLGQNSATIREAMRSNNCVGAIAACVHSAGSINVLEPPSCGAMVRSLFRTDAGKVLQAPDGTAMTPLEAVQWLEKKECEKSHE